MNDCTNLLIAGPIE